MGKAIMSAAAVSLDGYMADDNDGVGPMFDWLENGDVEFALSGSPGTIRTSQASADFMRGLYTDIGAVVMGRRLFDLTNGWNGVPASGDHVFVVTHKRPTDWEYEGKAPFTFVDSVEAGIAAAQEFCGDRIVDVSAGQMGGQALRLGLVDQVVLNVVPTVFGSGRPFFGSGPLPDSIQLDNHSQVVQGDRVTQLVYDVKRG